MNHRMRSSAIVTTLALTIGSIAAGCGNERDTFNSTSPPPAGFDQDAGTYTTVDAASACASETVEADQIPLSMFLVMDRSGSMQDANKWNQARQAMISFADSPAVISSKLGLTVFPPDVGDECAPDSYRPIVPISQLPGAAVQIKSELMSRAPNGGTPMAGAMQGAVNVMSEYLTANPGEDGIIILVTDGDPAGCGNIAAVAKVAELGAAAKRPVRTFVVGMDGATFSNLDLVALAGGGATKAFTASVTKTGSGTPQEQLLDALQQIRSGAIGCEYRLPAPSASQGTLDLNSVTVEFDPGNDEPHVTFRRVPTADDCSQATGGFYYDDNANPTRVKLCSASCEDVRSAASNGNVQVLLGCITVPH